MLAAFATAQENRDAGLGVLIGIGAIVAGVVVWRLVPARHYSRAAGLLVANAIVCGFAYAGIGVNGIIAFKFFLLTLLALLIGIASEPKPK